MCAPAALALGSLVIGAAQGVAQYQQASQAAERQNAYYAQNAANARAALVNSYAADQTKLVQDRDAASQQLFEGRIKAEQARATAITAAGESGVAGLSVNALLGDFMNRESRNQDAIDSNYQIDRSAIRSDMDAQQSGAQSRINSVQQAVAPSFWDAGLRIAGSAVGAGASYYNMNNAAKSTPNLGGFIG